MIKRYVQALGSDNDIPAFGTPVEVGYTDSLTPGTVCSLSQTVWLEAPNTDIATGVTVYLNKRLTSPLLGQNYIRSSTGLIFEISGSGVVGAPYMVGGSQVSC